MVWVKKSPRITGMDPRRQNKEKACKKGRNLSVFPLSRRDGVPWQLAWETEPNTGRPQRHFLWATRWRAQKLPRQRSLPPRRFDPQNSTTFLTHKLFLCNNWKTFMVFLSHATYEVTIYIGYIYNNMCTGHRYVSIELFRRIWMLCLTKCYAKLFSLWKLKFGSQKSLT